MRGEKTKLLWQNPEYRKMMSEKHKGQKAWNKGTKGICKANDGSFKKGSIPWKKGKTGFGCSDKTRLKIAKANSGEKSHWWKGGKSKVYTYVHYKDVKYKIWRKKVFERDNFVCQKCGAKSGNGKAIILNAHHIKGWTKYPKLRFVVNNGMTLCKKCHHNIHFNH